MSLSSSVTHGIVILIAVGALCSVIQTANGQLVNPDDAYELGPESQRNEGVPQGSVTKHEWKSSVFEGTIREYSLYVPKQYDGSQPASLMVFQDGHAYVNENGQMRVPVVFDNMIHRGEMPVTIGLFIDPGHKGETLPSDQWRANNRSFEYDTLSEQYAKFVVEELVPHVIAVQKLNISSNADDRAICGMSSGGICAFTAAWEHPEWFSKVLSHIGSFTNIRGGHAYEAMIRKLTRKPIRVFLQDGENDLDNEHGNWWLANLQMAKALQFKGYDFKFVGGTGSHNGKHGGAILPESLAWLWRDHVVGKKATPNGAEESPVEATTVYEDQSLRFTGGEYKDEEFHYRLMKPPVVNQDQKYPLVIFLHGAGERGTDNALQLLYFPTQMAQPRWRDRFPCYLLAPQCRTDRKWMEVDWTKPVDPELPETQSPQLQAVVQMIERTVKEEQIDVDRVYLTGLSMGGFGSLDMATRRPDLFAAVAPICGAADTTKVMVLRNTPMWIAHGDADMVVPVDRSRSLVKTLRDAGGNPVYVELPGVSHNSWTPSYTDEDGLVPWLFRQRRVAK